MKPSIIGANSNVMDIGVLDDIAISFEDPFIVKAKRNKEVLRRTWIMLDGQKYFFKEITQDISYLAELLGEKVSYYFQLPTVHYDIVKATRRCVTGDYLVYGVISKWAREEQPYFMLKDFELENCSDSNLNIVGYLDNHYQNQPVASEFKAFLIRELYTKEIDRLPDEILLTRKDEKLSLAYLLDYECEFRMFPVNPRIFSSNLYGLSFTDLDFLRIIRKDESFQRYIEMALKLDLLKMLRAFQEEYQIRLKTREDNWEEYFMQYQVLQRSKFQSLLNH